MSFFRFLFCVTSRHVSFYQYDQHALFLGHNFVLVKDLFTVNQLLFIFVLDTSSFLSHGWKLLTLNFGFLVVIFVLRAAILFV